MQSDSLYSSVFFEHYNRILLCDRVLGHYSVRLRACACRNTFILYLALTMQGWTKCPTLDVVLYQVSRVSEQWCYPAVLPPNSLVMVLLCLFLSTCIVQTVCVCTLWTSCLLQNLKIKKINQIYQEIHWFSQLI